MNPLQHPRLRQIADYLAGVRSELDSIVAATPVGDMGRGGSDSAWSGAQIIEHLGKTEGGIAKMLERAFSAAIADGLDVETETSSLLSSLDRFSIEDAAVRPLVAPDRLRPAAAPDFAGVWASLQAVRLRTLRAYETVDGRALSRVSAPHPFLGPLNGYEWFVFLGKHEARHIGQMRRKLSAR